MVSLHSVIDYLVIVVEVVVVGAESVHEGDIAVGQDHFVVLPANLVEVTGLKMTRFHCQQNLPVLFVEPSATTGVEEEGLNYLGKEG